jgi:HSP20 family protein
MTTLTRRNQNQGWFPLFFNDFFKDDWKVGTSSTVPAINVKEAEHSYTVEVAAAGMTKDDFTVHIDDDNDLVITMEKKNENQEENKDARYLRREFTYSKFRQTMVLPENVNKDKIEAKVEHGVLTVQLPKLTEQDIQKKQRSINVG